MTDATKKPGVTPATTPKGKTTTELDDAALDRVSGGTPASKPPPPTPTVRVPNIRVPTVEIT
jgi:hypothetical protein